MRNKRDQVQAHMFVMSRLTSAMLRAEPDDVESPNGRTNRGALIGVVIAVLVCAGAFVIGLLRPGGNDSWRSPGVFVVDKGTGASYLHLDGRLRPVRNYASARLIAGKDMKTVSVGSSSLRHAPHGAPVGLPGAPDALPDPADLDTGPWRVCATVHTARHTTTARTTLAVGAGPAAGIDGARGLSAREGVLVTGPDDMVWLLWQGTRLRLDHRMGALDALGYGAMTSRPVSAAFLDALPQGPDLAPPDIPGRGEAGPRLEGRATRVGQVFRVDVPGSESQYHLLTEDGLTPLTATRTALVLADPRTRTEAYGGSTPQAVRLGAEALTGHQAGPSGTPGDDAELPAAPPKILGTAAGQAVCAETESSGTAARTAVSLLPVTALGTPAQPPGGDAAPACRPVDAVTVRPGAGALVRAVGAGGGPLGDTTFLVTDTGVKYRLTGAEATGALGYGTGDARRLPAHLLAMLPTGPDLDPAAATAGRAGTTVRCGTEKR
ncbi:type VII secretion protein EccB [Streptomyces sp. NPDC017966]|uniref:type VII secretion protein EccB n=1 Tax=unclassified Streptomyces TaxID=2593676 RepID=UPI001C22D8F6|nr:type VII secretion protein EccB [Streptomyces sp. AC558_RSS880]